MIGHLKLVPLSLKFAEHESLIHVWAKRASDLSKRKQLNFSMIFVLINELSRLNSMLKSL